MKLYFHPFSQHARRVRILCQELGLKPDLVPVGLQRGEHMAADFLRINPAHAVPVLDDAGVILAESHAIMRYLCAKHGGERFFPAEPARRAYVDQWLDWTHCTLNPPVQTLAIQTLFAGDKAEPSVVENARQGALEALQVLDVGLTSLRGIGGETSLADIALGTTLALYEMCAGSFAGAARVQAHYQRLKTLPSFAATEPSMKS